MYCTFISVNFVQIAVLIFVNNSNELIDMATTVVTLTMQQRLEVLKDLETLPVSTVAVKYRVSNRTIQRIKGNASTILKFENKDRLQKKRQRLRNPVYSEIDQRLYSWFMERKKLGIHVSDALLLEKAFELKESIPSCSDFKVSDGWLSKFKNRNGIRLVRIYGGQASADETADENNKQNLSYEQKPEHCGIQLNARERSRMNSIFKELEAFAPRMLPSTQLHLQALKISILGSKQ